jgi:hypothetical protein
METKKTTKTETKVKKTKSSPKKAKSAMTIDVDNSLHSKIVNLETAYINAISGKIKFAEVKSIFKKIHKEIKATTKK